MGDPVYASVKTAAMEVLGFLVEHSPFDLSQTVDNLLGGLPKADLNPNFTL
jgi:hypothetical protein